MPKLLQRGCALEGCHSPDGFNDFRLRSGSKGSFAPLALRRNYEALLHEFMALDTVDVKQSRAVKKNIVADVGRHRPPRRPDPGGCGPDRDRVPAAVRRRRPTRARSACSRNGTASSAPTAARRCRR